MKESHEIKEEERRGAVVFALIVRRQHSSYILPQDRPSNGAPPLLTNLLSGPFC